MVNKLIHCFWAIICFFSMLFLSIDLKKNTISPFVIDDQFFYLIQILKNIISYPLLSIIYFYYLGTTCLSHFYFTFKKLYPIKKNYHTLYCHIIKKKYFSLNKNNILKHIVKTTTPQGKHGYKTMCTKLVNN